MKSEEIRSRFLKFFENRGHKVIPSASLITSDEKGVTNQTLFNSAGMQPLIPYLLGEPHPLGKRLVNVQKCLRTTDIDDVGDKTHATFFEMLGNWSLGDYFKEEAIKWSFEFLTDKKEGLGLKKERLYVTVFEGDSNAPKDTEAFEIWRKYIPENRIYYMSAKSNWWEAGDNGPCGPDSEMFYDVTEKGLGDLDKAGYILADEKRGVVEVWNDVFMQYEKKDGKVIGKLKANNVDTGAGLERLAMVTQGVDNIYDTDLFKPVIEHIKLNATSFNIRAARIMADHIRTAVFLITDGVSPSNTDRGYVLRRLLRRAIRFGKQLGLEDKIYAELAEITAKKYQEIYSNVLENLRIVQEEVMKEMEKFGKTLERGIKEFGKGTDAFTLFTSYGFPLELITEIAKEKGIKIDVNKFNAEMKKHQDLSRVGAEQKFKGGLADANDPIVVRYHTATHLLHQALHDVLGEGVGQKGSNITSERLRFDFSYPTKMTDEERKKVEDIVNEKISEALPVNRVIMPKSEAEKTGARHFFGEKYGDEISIYYIGSDLKTAYSKEFCGGPHVKNTSELGKFKIVKEEAVSAGVRRIKATLNNK